MKIAGLMSGTSADGVDACLANIEAWQDGIRVDVGTYFTRPYPANVRERVLNARTIEDVCRLNVDLGEIFGRAVLELCDRAGVRPTDIRAIGSHGQTICHIDEPDAHATLQIGEPCVIAERTGVTTIADFRPRDIAAGGCGAPLVPMVDFLLFVDEFRNRVALNIGGIANVTVLPAGTSVDAVQAFDTGPGNMVLDGLVDILSDGRKRCDENGAMAAKGTVSGALLARLLEDPYSAAPPPKSTGREAFGLHFAEGLLHTGRTAGLSDEDILATATALTAHTIAAGVRKWAFAETDGVELIASGGGVRNPTLMAMLAEALPGVSIATSDDAGIPADAKEAVAFAVLAWLTLHGRPGNVRGATGASRPVVLGKIVPGSRGT
jgi:anhydro-N-acetylmuramic acid kinase